MKALRRSIKGEKEVKPHVSIGPKSAVAIVPPKKVIRALYDYKAQSAQELTFSRGDFFHVIGRENDSDWYEACNPALPDARGLVPVSFFQALGRTERDSQQSDPGRAGPPTGKSNQDSGYGDGPALDAASLAGSGASMPPPDTASQRLSKSGGKSKPTVYGIVMYDFQAERADELEAKAGEAIIIIAQSNPEWFVAKPIGRLGGPGLIPVSFVEIRDMVTNIAVEDPQETIRRAGIPRVEEWKKTVTDYKNSSITLGKFEAGGGPPLEQGMERMSLQQGPRTSQANGSGFQQSQQQQQQPPNGYNSQRNTQQNMQSAQPRGPTSSQLLAPVSARIPRYIFSDERYWFVIEATLEDGRTYELARYYEDFYDFQIALLSEFPVEAGNTGEQKRSLPYMPGPVNYVTDAITEGRLHNLDAYVKNLLAQPEYIARCNLVRQFFAPREADYEIDPNAAGEEYRLSGGSQPSSTDSRQDGGSRQSSKNNLNGGGYAQGLSAAPPRNGPGGMPPMQRQMSSLSQPSQSSISPGITSAGQAVKVKLSYNGDIIAIRVPSDVQYNELYDRIRERLKISAADQIVLSYKDEATGDKPSMISNADLDVAFQRNERLLIYVEVE